MEPLEVYDYQKQGIAFLKARKQALLFDDPGLGKTCQALLAIPKETGSIVVCPATVKSVWEREIRKWRPDFTPVIINGRGSFRLPNVNEVVIVNYDILPEFPPVLNIRRKLVLILDEVHACKSTRTQRSNRVKLLRKTVVGNGGNCYGLTGTPLLSRPDDTWGIASVLGVEKEVFGNYTNFLRVFNGIRVSWGMRFSKIHWGIPTPESVECIKRFGLGRSRTQVLPDLPTKTYETYTVDANVSQWNQVDIEKALEQPGTIAILRDEICTSKTKAALPYLLTLAEQEPLVVFTTHLESVSILKTGLNAMVISGEVSMQNRREAEEAFMSGRVNVIVGTIPAMGVGLTLTRSHHVVFIDRDWTPALNSQAEDRVCRIGQTKGVLVTDILANHPVEEIVYKTLMRKQKIIDASIDQARVGN